MVKTSGWRTCPLTAKESVIISIILIITISFSLFLYFQQDTYHSIRNSLFQQQLQTQNNITRAMAQHITSDLKLIMTNLQGMAYSNYLQSQDFSSNVTKNLAYHFFKQINSTTPVDRLIILDKKDIVKMNIFPKDQPSYLGKNFSFREWVRETKSQLSPQFSDSFVGIDGKNRIAVTYPIIIINKSSTSAYGGLVCVVIPTIELLQYYGNTYDIQFQYLSVLDRKATQLIHPVLSLVGKSFFGSYTQNMTGHNQELNSLVRTVMSGKPSSAIYQFINGERLNTGYPIILNGKSLYSVFVITPTSSIYSKIDTIMSKEKMEMFSLIVGIISAITVLIVFLGRMNSILNKEVTKRTRQLEESNGSLLMVNKKLESVNEQLKIHDKMQQEFLHLAAHELRGPIQSLLGFSEILSQNLGNTEPNGRHIKSINRNARRLKKLVNVVLDIAQIENNTLLMNKETFDLGPLILEIVMDYQSRFKEIKQVQDIEFVIDSGRIMDKPLLVVADKTRITQVITNLLDNAVEFVKRKDEVGKKTEINNKDNTLNKIIIRVQKAKASDNLTQIIVSIIDNGIGINKEVLPLLFTKFVSKSNMGTGLGLYISKKIVENHGGHIWAQNNYIENSEEEKWNSDYRNNGATFSFSLPLLDVDSYNNNNQNE